MFRTRLASIAGCVEFALIGILPGGFFGGLYFGYTGPRPALIGAATAAVLLILLHVLYYRQRSTDVQLRVKLGLGGFLSGALVGPAQVVHSMGYLGMAAGALAGAALFAFPVATLVTRLMKKGRYLSYRIEAAWISLTGLAAANMALWLAEKIARSGRIPKAWAHPAYVAYSLAIALVFFSLITLAPGFMVVANRSRPVIGSVLALIGGLVVLWVGVDIADILFRPGTGLYWAGLILGLLICTTALFGLAYPQMHAFAGALTLVFSILSLVGAAGGLLIGLILGLLGGTLMVAWNVPADLPAETNTGKSPSSS